MANVATGIVLLAGTTTFANEWYQTGQVNWRVPVATLLAAAAIDGFAHIDEKAAVGLSIMVLIAASVTKFNGKSTVDTLAQLFSSVSTKQPAPRRKVAVA
jgi:hypothetical protein